MTHQKSIIFKVFQISKSVIINKNNLNKIIKQNLKMKSNTLSKLINPQDSIKKIILHFNIDKTIIMRDLSSYSNCDIMVSSKIYNQNILN